MVIPSCLFPSFVLQKFRNVFLAALIPATYPTHLVFLVPGEWGTIFAALVDAKKRWEWLIIYLKVRKFMASYAIVKSIEFLLIY
jgi:hypothetical protein